MSQTPLEGHPHTGQKYSSGEAAFLLEGSLYLLLIQDNSLLPHQLKNRVGAGAQPPPKLKVERDDVFMATYAKRYPVVRIKFTGASGPTFADFVDCLRRRIASEYEIHGYLEWMLAERGDSASKAKLAYFQRIRFVFGGVGKGRDFN